MALERLTASAPAVSIREGFIVTFPYIILINLIDILSEILRIQPWISFPKIAFLDPLTQILYALIPHIVIVAIAVSLARRYNVQQASTAIVALIGYWILSESIFPGTNPNSTGKFTFWNVWVLPSIIITFPLYLKLSRFRFFYLSESQTLGPIFQESINSFLPLLATIACLVVVKTIVNISYPLLAEILLPAATSIIDFLPYLLKILLYVVFVNFLWFFGVHGYNISANIFLNLQSHADANALINPQFLDLYVHIGGAGSTLSLITVMLLTAKDKRHKNIAKIAAPMGMLNVNEVILFGLPITFNLRLFVPFITLPIVTTLISYMVLTYEIVPSPNSTFYLHWMIPPIFNTYMATEGSLMAVGLQLLCFMLGILFYYPFFRTYESNIEDHKQIDGLLKKLEIDDKKNSHGSNNIFNTDSSIYALGYYPSYEELHHDAKLMHELEKGKFVLFYQPKMESRTGDIVGFEALLRHQDKNGSCHPPTFLPTIRRLGLHKILDRWVLHTACDQIEEWTKLGLRFQLSINISADFFTDDYLINMLKQRSTDFKSLSLLEIEIVEQEIISDFRKAAKVISELHKLGIMVSIDDFGTGYSTLSYIMELEADFIKIDRSFAKKCETARGKKIIKEIVDLAHQLNIKVVMEGIENDNHLRIAKQLQADVLQGYRIGKPMSAEKLETLIRCWS